MEATPIAARPGRGRCGCWERRIGMGSEDRTGFTCVVTQRDGAAVLTVTGDLDMTSAAEFRRGLLQAMSRRTPPFIIADLREVGFCDSSGLGALISAANTTEAAGGRLVLSGVQSRLARLLKVTGLDKRFQFSDPPGGLLGTLTRVHNAGTAAWN
ncbi:anti-sigma factor antagonist [Nonomuraea mesophila]|uniref:Anti-sigma factor antagonist n=2 Tax=Nonomuraea mesophila TaxID=2530382 RepID=A0A4R5FPX3_9ACTN|nr:anti-sigma factor antagonist [Nonomuraea mesophila]